MIKETLGQNSMGMKTYPSQNQHGALDEDDCPHSHRDWPISNPDPLHRGHLDLTPSPFPNKSVRFVTSARAASNCTKSNITPFIISRCALSCDRQAQDMNGVHHEVTFQYLTAEWVWTDVWMTRWMTEGDDSSCKLHSVLWQKKKKFTTKQLEDIAMTSKARKVSQ